MTFFCYYNHHYKLRYFWVTLIVICHKILHILQNKIGKKKLISNQPWEVRASAPPWYSLY